MHLFGINVRSLFNFWSILVKSTANYTVDKIFQQYRYQRVKHKLDQEKSALGILGRMRGKKMFIFTCYGWKKAKLLDVFAGQYGFEWRLCGDMEKLGYTHPDILLACDYPNTVTLDYLLQDSNINIDRYKDVTAGQPPHKGSADSVPLQLKFLVAPCGAEDFKLFMASAWTLAVKIFQPSSFRMSTTASRLPNSRKARKDFRQDLGRSSWFSKLYNLYLNGKIAIDSQGDFYETRLEDEAELDSSKISGIFKELSPIPTEVSSDMFADVNLDKVLNYKFCQNGGQYLPDTKPASTLFFDLIKGDGFDYTPPIEWIVAETVLNSQKSDAAPTLKRKSSASISKLSIGRMSFLSAVLIHSQSAQEQIFSQLHEDFKVDLSHITGDSLKYGNFFKPVALFVETKPVNTIPLPTKNRKDIFLGQSLASGQLSENQIISLKDLSTVLEATKKAGALAKTASRRAKSMYKKSL